MKPKLEDGICQLCDKDSDDLEDGICQRCIRKREADLDEEMMDRDNLKRTNGRDGSEDEGY